MDEASFAWDAAEFAWNEAEKDLMGGIDTTVAHAARVWNFWLGGKDNYPIDQTVGDHIVMLHPGIVDLARTGQLFLCRAVRHLAGEAGIEQFLDIGVGFPAVDNTHEVAQRIAPESYVVYVDNDPLVLSHARALLTSAPPGVTGHIDADLRDPERILKGAAETLDFTWPVAVLLLGVLHFIDDDGQAQAIVDHLMEILPSGSYLAISHLTGALNPAAMEQVARHWNAHTTPPLTLRTPERIASFFDRLELVEPGVVSCSRWRPEHGPFGVPAEVDHFCGLGVKP